LVKQNQASNVKGQELDALSTEMAEKILAMVRHELQVQV
jgi:hypothetical protein